MNQKISLLIIFCLSLTVCCTQQTSRKINELDIDKLRETRTRLAFAMLQGDVKSLNKIYHEDYGLVTRKGAIRSREERLKMFSELVNKRRPTKTTEGIPG